MTTNSAPNLTSSKKIELYVEGYDYDQGCQALLTIMSHPLCDRGTALAMFWRSGSAYLLRYGSRQEVPVVDLDGYDLVKGIETRYLADDFTHRSVVFNPRSDRGTDWTVDYVSTSTKLPFSEAMLENSAVALGRKSSRIIKKR